MPGKFGARHVERFFRGVALCGRLSVRALTFERQNGNSEWFN